MRIGFFTDSYFPRKDGTSYTIRTWKRRLERRGHEVELYYPDSPAEVEGHPQPSIKDPLYKGHYIPFPGFSEIEDLEVVHCHSPYVVSLKGLRYARKHSDVKSVYTFHTPLRNYASELVASDLFTWPLESVVSAVERRFMSQFDTVTCSADCIPYEMDFERLPVGVDAQFFSPTEEKPFEIPEGTVIGHSGRMSEEQNLEQVLELAERTDYSFVIVGEGRARNDLEEKAPENVEFHDFLPREDLPKFYSSIDVFITASDADTFSLTTMEANLCGTPVVAPDLPPFDETIQQENGVRYEFGDIESMEEAVRKATNLSYDTRTPAKQYSVEKTIDNLIRLYRK